MPHLGQTKSEIVSDEFNRSVGGVDVQLETDIYLKDMKQVATHKDQSTSFEVYSDEDTEAQFGVKLIVKNKTLMSPVIDVDMPKALPTNEIAINTKPYQDHQYEWMVDKINQLPQIKLPEGQQKPVVV